MKKEFKKIKIEIINLNDESIIACSGATEPGIKKLSSTLDGYDKGDGSNF